jgi:hypothetical protein
MSGEDQLALVAALPIRAAVVGVGWRCRRRSDTWRGWRDGSIHVSRFLEGATVTRSYMVISLHPSPLLVLVANLAYRVDAREVLCSLLGGCQAVMG